MLLQIGAQLRDISTRLERIDSKLDLVLSEMEKLRSGQVDILASLKNRIDALDKGLGAMFRNLRSDHVDILTQDFVGERVTCGNIFPEWGELITVGSPSGNRLAECLSRFETHASETAKLNSLTYRDFNLRSDNLATLRAFETPANYVGVLPQIAEAVRLNERIDELPSGGKISDLDGLAHPQALADGMHAFIEFRERRPEFAYPNESSILLKMTSSAEQFIRAIDLAHSASLYPQDSIASTPYLNALRELESALRKSQEEYFAYEEAQGRAQKNRGLLSQWACLISDEQSVDCYNRRPDLFASLTSATPRQPDLNRILAYFTGAEVWWRTMSRTDKNQEIVKDTPSGAVASINACAQWRFTVYIEKDLSESGLTAPLPQGFHTLHHSEGCWDISSAPKPSRAAAIGDMQSIWTANAQALPHSPKSFVEPPGQKWSDLPTALALSQGLIAKHRVRMAKWIHSEILSGRQRELASKVEALDRQIFNWEALERFGYGKCFQTIPAKVELFGRSKALLRESEVMEMLQAGDLLKIPERIAEVQKQTTKIMIQGLQIEMPLIQAARIQSYDQSGCSRYPAALTSAMTMAAVRTAMTSKRSSAKTVGARR
jgi:hypothetical protein